MGTPSSVLNIPAQIAPYVEVLGIDGAREFLMEFGGAELYLATRPTERSRLVQLVGKDKATALAKAAERLPARVPVAKQWLAHVLFYKEGLSKSEIARKLHTTDVTVRGYLKKPLGGPARPIDDAQLRLF